MSAIYQNWGFRQNPFSSTPLAATEEGAELIVGRDAEIAQIKTRLGAPPKMVTVEGRNGIGKTSVINVAAFRALEAFNAKPGESPLLIPCHVVFQLEPEADANEFARHVLGAVAIALTKYSDVLSKHGRTATKLNAVAAWVKASHGSSYSGGISTPYAGFSAGKGVSPSTSDGFKNTGFEDAIREVLSELFPDEQGGGVVCVVDNLELMRSSKSARETVEALRDKLFTIPGLRWVLSGSAGIVRGVASTARLSGYLYDPVEIGNLEDSLAQSILSRRVKFFRVNGEAGLPISGED